MPKQLPEHPNLEHLKRQAKDLLKSQRAAGAPPELALHDAQTALAREYGFPSWNAMRQRVEELTLDFEAATREFALAATDGRGDRAERLLTRHPRIAKNPYAALVLGEPGFATAAGGPRDWAPLHYVCHSAVGARTPQREAGLAAIARDLIAAGADPNLRFPWEHHNVQRPVLWGAVRVTRSLALARVLLEAGANPSDGVTLVLAASAADIAALDLLAEFGVNVNQPWAADGTAPLYAILQWTEQPVGALWLLAHGADPNPVCAANGETPLHLSAARYGLELTQALVARGANPLCPRADGRTPYALAELNGNRAVAEWLRSQGAATELADVDQLVAACSRGDSATALVLLRARPELRAELGLQHYAAFWRAAEKDDVAALEVMLDCGFDPNYGDPESGRTALHAAAMAGHAAAVRTLLAHGAAVDRKDREYQATALFWAAQGAHEGRPGRDLAEVGRLLLAAGAAPVWDCAGERREELMEIVRGWGGNSC